jgi:hypothetical protein
MADVRLVIEIKPFKPVAQDDQSGVDNQGFWFHRSCERVQQACAIDPNSHDERLRRKLTWPAIIW